MRARLRKILSWIVFGAGVTIAIAVVGEWFIKVAEDKGVYQNAGQRWDGFVSAVLSFITSAWVVVPFMLLAGAAGALWLDYFLKKMEPGPGLSAEQVKTLIAERIAATNPTDQLPRLPALDHPAVEASPVTLQQVEEAFADRMSALHQAISDLATLTSSPAIAATDAKLNQMMNALASKHEAEQGLLGIAELRTRLNQCWEEIRKLAFDPDIVCKDNDWSGVFVEQFSTPVGRLIGSGTFYWENYCRSMEDWDQKRQYDALPNDLPVPDIELVTDPEYKMDMYFIGYRKYYPIKEFLEWKRHKLLIQKSTAEGFISSGSSLQSQ